MHAVPSFDSASDYASTSETADTVEPFKGSGTPKGKTQLAATTKAKPSRITERQILSPTPETQP